MALIGVVLVSNPLNIIPLHKNSSHSGASIDAEIKRLIGLSELNAFSKIFLTASGIGMADKIGSTINPTARTHNNSRIKNNIFGTPEKSGKFNFRKGAFGRALLWLAATIIQINGGIIITM